MSDRGLIWEPCGARSTIVKEGRGGLAGGKADILLEPVDQQSLATLVACRDGHDVLAERFHKRFGCELPGPCSTRRDGSTTVVSIAPGQWLVAASRDVDLADLPSLFAGCAAVTDQSDSRVLVRIGGPRSRAVLAKGIAIDLHPSAFTKESAAVTSLVHVGALVWMIDDAPTYMLAVPRSFFESVWSFLTSSAAEHGYDIARRHDVV